MGKAKIREDIHQYLPQSPSMVLKTMTSSETLQLSLQHFFVELWAIDEAREAVLAAVAYSTQGSDTRTEAETKQSHLRIYTEALKSSLVQQEFR